MKILEFNRTHFDERSLNLKTIHVYKTNLNSMEDVTALRPILDRHSDIVQWTIDLEDVDKVLRIIAKDSATEKNFQLLLTSLGFECNPL